MASNENARDFELWEKQMASPKRGTVAARDAELEREAMVRAALAEQEGSDGRD